MTQVTGPIHSISTPWALPEPHTRTLVPGRSSSSACGRHLAPVRTHPIHPTATTAPACNRSWTTQSWCSSCSLLRCRSGSGVWGPGWKTSGTCSHSSLTMDSTGSGKEQGRHYCEDKKGSNIFDWYCFFQIILQGFSHNAIKNGLWLQPFFNQLLTPNEMQINQLTG